MRRAGLRRELELSVERFAREAEGALAERIDSELRAVEARIAELDPPARVALRPHLSRGR